MPFEPRQRWRAIDKRLILVGVFIGIFAGLFAAATLQSNARPGASWMQAAVFLGLGAAPFAAAALTLAGLPSLFAETDDGAREVQLSGLGIVVATLGAFITASSLGVDPDDAKFPAGRAVAALAGSTFFAAGLWLFVAQAGRGARRWAGLSRVLVAVLVTLFAATAVWFVVGAGSREGGTMSIDGASATAPGWVARLIFSPGAIILSLIAGGAWYEVIRSRRRPPPSK